MIECVPNFSDGRDAAIGSAIRAAITAVDGVRLLGWHSDPDHNRSVATFAGETGPVGEAALAAIARASQQIDLRNHQGVHPRLGATDVCPFVPLRPDDMPVCVATAHELGRRVAGELGIPVYFYGEAALTPERRALPVVRRGGYEGLVAAIAEDPARAPDIGPRKLHPRAGAIAIGARGFLVAFNVVLESADLAAARTIARAIRESDGGLPGVRALGFPLSSRGVVQVSVNLCEPARTGLRAVFDAISAHSARLGVGVRESELVGLAPAFALDEQVARAVRLPGFDPRAHVLEEALRAQKES